MQTGGGLPSACLCVCVHLSVCVCVVVAVETGLPGRWRPGAAAHGSPWSPTESVQREGVPCATPAKLLYRVMHPAWGRHGRQGSVRQHTHTQETAHFSLTHQATEEAALHRTTNKVTRDSTVTHTHTDPTQVPRQQPDGWYPPQ